jgi:3-phosphoglycerate kinase
MRKKTVTDVDVEGKRVLLRIDFNVPLNVSAAVISGDSPVRPQFAQGTRAIASFLSTLDAATVAGRGSSAEVV